MGEIMERRHPWKNDNIVILCGIMRMINGYETETAEHPISITISKDHFNQVLEEVTNDKYVSIPKDPYTDGIIIEDVLIKWEE